MKIKRALISVSDKTGVVEFARRVAAAGVELVSTGGTATSLRAAGLAVRDVADVTQFPEMLDGRVKTLHPAIHGGILAKRGNAAHETTIQAHGIEPIDLVVVNLYPFQQTISRAGVTREEAIEQIDIGGPAMLRSAAKNHDSVTAVVDPADYNPVATEIEEAGETTEATRRRLAGKVFAHTAAYDSAVANYLTTTEQDASRFPAVWAPALPVGQVLRYGENPHQQAAFYRDPSVTETSVAGAVQLQGKELSYNNILDAEGALEMVRDFADLAPAAAVIVKHSNPCGIAIGKSAAEAYAMARNTDPDSAFGGIVALSCEIDEVTAEGIAATFNEVVIAPSISAMAMEVLAKKKNMRVLATGPFTARSPLLVPRGVVGGVLLMDRDLAVVSQNNLKIVSKAQPTAEDLAGLLFAWRCVKWVKSNAIVYAAADHTIGIGAGQMSRVDSARIGVLKSRSPLAGCYMASDAFFPFRDSVDAAAREGVRAIVQPGGSVRDAEVIAAADEHGIIMAFTGVRHFRH